MTDLDVLDGDRFDKALIAPLAALHEYWDTKRAGRPMPSRQDIDPVEMKPWLGNLALLRVLDGGADMHYDVFGVALVSLLGFDLTGRTLKGAGALVRPQVLAKYRQVCRTKRPLLSRNELVASHEFIRIEALSLPLSDDGHSVTRVLTGIYRAESSE